MLTPLFLTLVLGGYEIIVDRAHNAVEITTGSHYDNLGDAIQSAADLGWGTVRLPHGSHSIGTPLAVSSTIRLELREDTIITASATEDIGFGTFAGERTIITGGTILVPVAVDDQVVVELAGNYSSLSGTAINMTATDGSGSNPVTLLKITDCQDSGATHIRIHPNAGARAFWAYRAINPYLRESQIIPEADETTRKCWRVFDIEEGAAFHCMDNAVRNIGDASNLCDAILLATEATDTQNSHGDIYESNYFYFCAANNTMLFKGRKGIIISNNIFFGALGINDNNLVSTHDATLLFTNTSGNVYSIQDDPGSTTDLPEFSAHVRIHNNIFDGNSSNTAPEVDFRHIGKFELSENHFTHVVGRYAVLVHVLHTQNGMIQDNYFDGASGVTQLYPVFFFQPVNDDSGGLEEIGSTSLDLWRGAESITLKGNKAEGWLYGQNYAVVPNGQGQWPIQLGLRGVNFTGQGSPFSGVITSNTLTFNTATITDSANGLGAIAAGDFIEIVGEINEENNGLRIVATASAGSVLCGNPGPTTNCDPTFNSGNGWNFVTEANTAGVRIYIYKKDRLMTPYPSILSNTNILWKEL